MALMSFKHKHFGSLLNVKTEVGHDFPLPFLPSPHAWKQQTKVLAENAP